jgi:exonuclease VII small subunit
MKIPRQAITTIVLALAAFGLSIQGTSASELSDAESRLDQLRQSLESDTQLLNVTLRGYEIDAFNCVQRYASDTTPEGIALKNDCQTALDRTQADIFNVTRRAAATQSEMSSVRATIERLKSAPPTPSPSPSALASVEPTQTAVTNTPAITDTSKELTSPATSATAEPTKGLTSPATSATAEPTPAVTKNPDAKKTPEAKPSVSPSAKPIVKIKATPKKSLRSITCVKGKISKKLTGVNAKCPKGYKKK